MKNRENATALTVLIADDAQAVADMLADLVADPGRVEVVGMADSAPGTVDAIRRLRPDVAILDLQLKTGSGADVIRAVRADPGLAGVRLIVTSNHTEPRLKAGCIELGADAYFDKVKELGLLTQRLASLAEAKLTRS